MAEKYVYGGCKMKVLNELKYSKTHEWVQELEDGKVRIGITDYAQDQLGDIVYVTMPEEGDELVAGEAFTDVESVKAVADVLAPVNGKICAVNEELEDAPELINEEPYGAWIAEAEDVSGIEELMDAEAYEKFLKEQE